MASNFNFSKAWKRAKELEEGGSLTPDEIIAQRLHSKVEKSDFDLEVALRMARDLQKMKKRRGMI